MKHRLGLVALLLLVTAPKGLLALNGAQLTGFTAINESLGGSGVALPQDSSTLLVNPAGLSQLPRRVDFNILMAFPKSVMDTSAALAGGGNATTAGGATSNDDPVILPGGSFILPTSLLNDKLSFGMGIIPVAGFSLDYPASRLTSGLTGNIYDTQTYYGVLKVVEGAAYKINDQWSVGLAVHVDHAQFATNSATLALGFPQTTGRDRMDSSFGIGAGAGILYKPFDCLSVGASYTSQQWMQDFKRYADLLPTGGTVNLPQQVNAGVSVSPLKNLWVSTDFRWINWTGAKGAFGTSVAGGGLGWQDQYIALAGVQYQLLDWLTLRGGYNYGRSAIPASSIFASQLASPISEHHVSGGFGLKLNETLRMDFSYLRTLSNTVTDDGTQSAGAAGASTTQSVHQFSSQVGLNF
ncbi:MAG: outer membrane protein transport protein [Deltaproteobacteria bacterium]|nr:outer membrane protein transport protein [Deltaproteobacteria bacterium]